MNPRISIIILNWNGWRDTVECLESLYQISYSSYDVIVLDNGSGDNSLESLKRYSAGDLSIGSKFFESTTENRPIKILEYTNGEAELGGGRENDIADLPTMPKACSDKKRQELWFCRGK